MNKLNSTTPPLEDDGTSEIPRNYPSELIWSDYIQIASFASLLIIGGFMNLVSFIYFGFRKTRFKSNYRYFIAHLSFADLACCIMTPVFTITLIANKENWIFGIVSCNYIYPLARLSGSLPAWILCGMTYERYRAFTNPFRKVRKRTIHIYMIIVWFIFISYSMTYSIYPKSTEPNVPTCSHTARRKSVYLNLVKANIKITVPSFIIIILCIRLKRFLKNNNDINKTSNEISGDSHQNELQTVRVQRRRRDKSEKMILYSATSHLVCVLPNYVVHMVSCLLILTEQPKSSYPSVKEIRWALIFFYTNSVINVVIYAGRFKDFRKFIFEILHLSK